MSNKIMTRESTPKEPSLLCNEGLRFVVALLLLMVVGVSSVWGQTGTDRSGVFYFVNGGSGKSSPADPKIADITDPNEYFYLVPADGPKQDNKRDAWFSSDYSAANGDSEKPYLTTYKTRKDAAAIPTGVTNHPHNSVWIVKFASTDLGTDYYNIIHAATGKYVVYEPPYSAKNNRKSVHLLTTDSPGENAKFAITSYSGEYYNFRPKSIGTGASTNKYLNTANANYNYYYSSDKYADSSADYFRGLVGLWKNAGNVSDGSGSDWKPDATLLSAPTIEYDSENEKFIISYDKIPEGFEILYTTDNSDPTIGGSTTQTYTNETVISLATIGDNPLKAVVVRYGLILSETASIRKPNNPIITPVTGDCSNKVSITSEEGTNIYYTLDGTDPTSSSTPYIESFALNSAATIKAIAYSGNLHSGITTSNYSPNYSGKPAITQSGATITISGTGTIYYTTNGDDPDTGSTQYDGPFTLSGSSGDVITIKAVAKDGSKELSCVAEKTVTMGYFISDLASLEAISSHSGDLCILTANIDASGLEASISNFTGEFDGGFHTISGLSVPLFDNLSGGTVKNVMLSGVGISGIENAGAICGEADGATKIYNCGVLSGSVSGSGNVGGLVGLIKAGSSVRVVNCYNFATVSGGSTMAGIVGNNQGTVGNVRIAMCMMYGDMSGGTSPVYAGNHVSNVSNFTEYNYWRSKANLSYTTYNDQLAIDKDDYLTRFPFYRHILNTHRELAAFFLFGESGETVGDITADEVAEIGHWVLKKDVAAYPIIEEWQTNTKRTIVDIAANLPNTTDKGAGKLLNDIGDDDYYTGTGTKVTAMGNSGYLKVNLSINGSSYSVNLPITDMDEANYDYTWGKVVLPFANEFSGWTRDYSKVCTGWEITSVTGGTAGTFAHYNVADRDCTDKDLYENSDYIFAQGGNYIVPYGVTAINVTAHFANAFYLSDASYEVGYDTSFGSATALGGSVPTTFHGRTVYTSLETLVTALSETTNPHDQAIVLVGNFHNNIKVIGNKLNTSKAVTIMSTDEDCNQEPDYGWYTCNLTGRLDVPPLRFDFVPNIEMGMSSRVGSSVYPGIGIWHARGWFELTETCVSKMIQCEINDFDFTNSDNGKGNNRWIANSGYFTQIVRARDGNCDKLSYIQIGGNAYVKELYPGCHTDNARTNTAVPIAVAGGQVEECYMTGYKTDGKLNGDLYFWCTGGKIGKFLGAYLEEPIATTGTTAGITAKVDHALIGRFFGGGTSAAARIKGNIDITINNSTVDFYCGGPEFGNMESGKTVTTHAIGTTFGEYYGAGFGGTSITYNREEQTNNLNITNAASTTYNLSFTTYYKRLTNKSGYGLGSCYKFEFIFHSDGSQGVTRFYTGYAQFDLATTGNVTNILSKCKVKKLPGSNSLTPLATSGDFYGAGCQGKVDGTVTTTLTDCEVEGSAYGGGYKAESNEVSVYPATQPTYSVYTKETGIFSDFGSVEPEIYEWKPGTAGTSNQTNKELYTGMTQAQMDELGNVTGDISITIGGDSKIGTGMGGGSVYGGGNESKSLNNTTITLKGKADIQGNVFGGGNKAVVGGSATVNIQE